MNALLVFMLSLLFVGQQGVPSPAHGTITAIEVLNSYIAATGGVEPRRNIQAIEMQGALTIPPIKPHAFDFRFWQGSNSDLFELETASHGIARTGHKDGNRFSHHTAGAIGVVADVSISLMEDTFQTLCERDWKSRFSNIELLGATEVEGKKALAIGFTSKNGGRQVRYYDSQTFLLVRIDEAQLVRESRSEQAAFKVEIYLSDYKPSDEILFPRTILYRCSNCGVQLTVQNIKTNSPIDDAVFRNF